MPKISQRKKELQQEILALRARGFSHQAIQVAMDLDPAEFRRLLAEAYRESSPETPEEQRLLDLFRCDRMIESLWEAAVGGEMVAQREVREWMKRRASLLGLNLPSRLPDDHREALAMLLGVAIDRLPQRQVVTIRQVSAAPESVDAEFTECPDSESHAPTDS